MNVAEHHAPARADLSRSPFAAAQDDVENGDRRALVIAWRISSPFDGLRVT
jgi:hypothetical protein